MSWNEADLTRSKSTRSYSNMNISLIINQTWQYFKQHFILLLIRGGLLYIYSWFGFLGGAAPAVVVKKKKICKGKGYAQSIWHLSTNLIPVDAPQQCDLK